MRINRRLKLVRPARVPAIVARDAYDAAVCPKEFGVNSPVRTGWAELPESIQFAIARRAAEARAGKPIVNDRMFGREKRDPKGFWGLSEAEDERYCRQQKGEPTDAVEKRIADLRAKLAPDIASLAELESVGRYFEYAEAQGLTLAQWIGECVRMEQAFRRDFFEGMIICCDRIGHDPLAILAQVLQQERAA